jgi:hypothetical protein
MPSESIEDCYCALGLSPPPPYGHHTTYTKHQLRQAYLTRALKTHPDRNPRDPAATRTFQHLTDCYGRVRTHAIACPPAADADADACPPAADIDLNQYKRAFEKMAYRASVFWNTSPEAKLLKEMWQTYSERSRAVDKSVPTTSAEPTDEPESEPEPEPDIRFTLRIPLEDVYQRTPQKLSYMRMRMRMRYACNRDDTHATVYEEEQTLLIHTDHKHITFYGEGHEFVPGVKGNVCITIVPDIEFPYRFDDTAHLLQYEVHVSSAQARQMHAIDVFGTEVVFTLPECDTQIRLDGCGLYDSDKGERSALLANVHLTPPPSPPHAPHDEIGDPATTCAA